MVQPSHLESLRAIHWPFAGRSPWLSDLACKAQLRHTMNDFAQGNLSEFQTNPLECRAMLCLKIPPKWVRTMRRSSLTPRSQARATYSVLLSEGAHRTSYRLPKKKTCRDIRSKFPCLHISKWHPLFYWGVLSCRSLTVGPCQMPPEKAIHRGSHAEWRRRSLWLLHGFNIQNDVLRQMLGSANLGTQQTHGPMGLPLKCTRCIVRYVQKKSHSQVQLPNQLVSSSTP